MEFGNTLFYGPDERTRAEARRVIGDPVLLPPSQPDGGGSSSLFYERRSRSHFEYDFALVYNAAAMRECINSVTAVACLRRIDGRPLDMLLLNVQALMPDDRPYIKTLVDAYSDRTRFVLTTTSFAAVPRGLSALCTPVRVPAPPPDTSAIRTALLDVMAARQPRKAARAFAYACCNAGTPFALVARAVVELGGSEMCEPAAQCERLAGRIRRDIVAWEALLNCLLMQTGVRPSRPGGNKMSGGGP